MNVISKRGSNEWHGSVFMNYGADRFNANPNPSLIRNPQIPANLGGAPRLDQPLEYYYPVKDHSRIVDPGFTARRRPGQGSSLDIRWHCAGFQSVAAHGKLHLSRSASGARTFNDNNYTYYSVRARWISGPPRRSACMAPGPTTMRAAPAPLCRARTIVHNQFNSSSTSNPDNFNGGIGFCCAASALQRWRRHHHFSQPGRNHAVRHFLLQ